MGIVGDGAEYCEQVWPGECAYKRSNSRAYSLPILLDAYDVDKYRIFRPLHKFHFGIVEMSLSLPALCYVAVPMLYVCTACTPTL
jgi:hypothetical protein